MGIPELAHKLHKDQLSIALRYQDMPQAFRAHSDIGILLLSESEDTLELIQKEKLAEATISFYKAHEALDSCQALIDAGLLASSRRKELNELRLEARINDGRLSIYKGEYDSALG